MTSIKENDGQGARRALTRRVITLGLACCVLGVALLLLGALSGDQVGRRMRNERTDRQKKQRNRESDNFFSGMLGAKKDRMIEVDADDLEQLQPLLSGQVHLVDVFSNSNKMAEAPANSYSGLTGEFCRIDFDQHKKDPSLVPMFRHLVSASPECREGTHYRVDIKKFAQRARRHDAIQVENGGMPRALNLTGVVFHESRCGSTLVANALIAMDPLRHRVYSESAPPIAALKTICGDTYHFCSVHQAAEMLSDIMYIMSRSNNPDEKRVFFKIQSIGTRNIEVFQNAFPRTPWIFVYRDPVQVLMSQLKMGPRAANCVRPRVKRNNLVDNVVEKRGLVTKELSDEQYCAAHLATITESAVEAMQREPQLGTPVNYNQLPDILWTNILPQKFGVPVSSGEIERIKNISGVYSKGTGGRHGEYKDDSKEKDAMATEKIRAAAQTFLQESFDILEKGGAIAESN